MATRVAEVSAVVATLDRPAGLARCLDALLSGSVVPAEITVVDQGSDDTTKTLIEERHNESVVLLHIRQEGRGLSSSRNLGVSRARYRVVAVTDDDCVPDNEWVAVIDRTFGAESPPDALTGRILPFGPPVDGTYVVSPRTSTQRAVFAGKIAPWHVGSGANFATTRECFISAGGCNERLGVGSPGMAAEDIDLIYRLLHAGLRIRYEPDAIVYHERQTKRQRVTSRFTYGFGLGAFCAIWLRRGDLYSIRMLLNWLMSQTRAATIAALSLQWFELYQRGLSLSGTLRGVMYGLRFGKSRSLASQLLTDERRFS
jgi:glycosyltransferase involved in cell wall biosynthesis